MDKEIVELGRLEREELELTVMHRQKGRIRACIQRKPRGLTLIGKMETAGQRSGSK